MRLLREPDLLREVVSKSNTAIQDQRGALEAEREQCQRELSAVEDSIRNVVAFISRGRGTNVLGEELQTLDGKRQLLKERLARIDSQLRNVRKRMVDEASLRDGLAVFERIWQEATDEERAKLARLQLAYVIWGSDQIELGIWPTPVTPMPADDGKSPIEVFRSLKPAVGDGCGNGSLTGRGVVQCKDNGGSPIAT